MSSHRDIAVRVRSAPAWDMPAPHGFHAEFHAAPARVLRIRPRMP